MDLRTIETIFAVALDSRCDVQCPATQDAIDRIADAFGPSGRGRLLAVLRGDPGIGFVGGGLGEDTTGVSELGSLLFAVWKAADVKLATGRSREDWLKLLDGRNS